MKSILLVSIIAATAALSFGATAQAATPQATATTGAPAGHRMNGPHHMDRKCTMRTVRRHRNGQVVMEKVRSCH